MDSESRYSLRKWLNYVFISRAPYQGDMDIIIRQMNFHCILIKIKKILLYDVTTDNRLETTFLSRKENILFNHKISH